ncbi:MAG: OmpA family protein [Polyangiaceae bacterium]
MNHITKLAVASTFLVVGCAKDAPPPATPVPAPAAPRTNAEDVSQIPEKKSDAGNVIIDERIAQMCDIPTAYFAFDSSALSTEAKDALDALATCFTSGPAKALNMRIVGHADPRGELEYNMALGQRRASSVAGELESRGVSDNRIESSSRGELDAKGTDEASWAKDRNVEILLPD